MPGQIVRGGDEGDEGDEDDEGGAAAAAGAAGDQEGGGTVIEETSVLQQVTKILCTLGVRRLLFSE
jgi:hypothetical protein